MRSPRRVARLPGGRTRRGRPLVALERTDFDLITVNSQQITRYQSNGGEKRAERGPHSLPDAVAALFGNVPARFTIIGQMARSSPALCGPIGREIDSPDCVATEREEGRWRALLFLVLSACDVSRVSG